MRLPPRVHRILTISAAVFFSCGIIYSFWRLKDFNFRLFSPQAFGLVVLSVPVMLHLSIRRFQVVTAIYATRYAYREAAAIVVYGALANILPIPGAFMVRVASMANHVGMKKAVASNVLAYLVWILVSFLFVVFLHCTLLFSTFFSILVFILLLIVCLFLTRTGGQSRVMPGLFFVQFLLTITNIIRIFLISYCFNSVLGLDIVALIQLSGVVVSGIGVIPSGLGLAEGLAAMISAMAGELAAVGFALVATNRVLTWLGLLGAVFFIKKQRPSFLDRE